MRIEDTIRITRTARELNIENSNKVKRKDPSSSNRKTADEYDNQVIRYDSTGKLILKNNRKRFSIVV